MKKNPPFATMFLAACAMIGASTAYAEPRKPDPGLFTGPVDLDRYAGTWYQVLEARTKDAALYARAEGVKGDVCYGVTVRYERRGRNVRLENTCNKGGFDGPAVRITGTATPQDAANTRLKVRFDPIYLRPFQFDYWILDVDPTYQLALLASPNAPGVTILSRTRTANRALLQRALQLASARGFDPAASVSTPQPPETKQSRLNAPAGDDAGQAALTRTNAEPAHPLEAFAQASFRPSARDHEDRGNVTMPAQEAGGAGSASAISLVRPQGDGP